MTRTIRRHLLQALGFLAVLAFAMSIDDDARGDSVVQFMTAKSLPAATVAVIDPESGTSQGTAGQDVNLAVGDIILFRFSVASAPASAIDGIQSYLTEYVPAGTQVVGVRMVDANNNTVEPRRAGLSLDGCAGGSQCNSFTSVPSNLCAPGTTCNFNTLAGHGTGSIAQVYADTGIFITTNSLLRATPNNVFLTLFNGILMGGNNQPSAISPEIVQLLNDTSGNYFAHNTWDWNQVQAYGGSGGVVVGGKGNGPFKYGSPVAGPQSYYPFEATDSGSRIELDDVTGPWSRVLYPGSQIGAGSSNIGSTSNMTRVGVDTAAGTDVTPANPVNATAVRFAMGEPRTGEVRYVEVALRVMSLPIDPTFGTSGGNVDCGEVFGSDISSKAANTGGSNIVWPEYIGHPECVFLRLKLDVNVDKTLAAVGNTLTYTIAGKNLSVANETNAHFRLKFVNSDQAFISATPPPNRSFTCPGESNKVCEEWDLGTLTPSQEFAITAKLSVGGAGGGTNVVVGQYLSDQITQLDANGFQTTALTVVQPAAMPVITLTNHLDPTANFAAAGSTTWQIDGTVQNAGTTSWTSENFQIFLPAGWKISNGRINVGGTNFNCTGTGCANSSSPLFTAGQTYATLQSRAITFQVNPPAGTPNGLYTIDISTRGNQSVFGSFEELTRKAVTVPVGAVRTAKPVLDCPIGSTAPSISGTSEANAAIAVLFNLMQRGSGTATGAGLWTVSNYTAFGELYGGLEVRATATAPGKLASDLSDACFVTAVKQCSDGIDNDGDGLIDFPADPGCTSLGDNDETDPTFPQCNDGIDNDGDGFIDYPMDPQCTSESDNSETGTAQCSDGIDNDGDGAVDLADPDCNNDPNGREVHLRACQDGIDNDGDGHIDFPDDPGCDSAFDDSELDLSTPLDTRARILLLVDTSGSMNMNACNDTFTGGDGSTECAGQDVSCTACANGTCGDGQTDDSRIFQVTSGLSNVVAGFGEVDYALMRFHERPEEFSCPTSAASLQSGGWQGGGISPCSGGFNAGDLLVSFDPNNEQDILGWMNHDDDYPGTPPRGTDWELRASGTTPLAGILSSAKTYLDDVRNADSANGCRPYQVILVTDGGETCGGNPHNTAQTLASEGIPVHVIGFATPDPTIIANLNSIASGGGTGNAIFVSDEAALSQAMAQIIQSSILVEKCNNLDDDCDTLVDEDFPDKGAACDNGEKGQCFRTGQMVCTADGSGTVCNAPIVSGVPEICNGLDDDCDGFIDEDTGPSCTCVPLPEICNGRDDDCDGNIDEGTLPGVGQSCGTDVGACTPGALACVNGALTCQGGTGPTTEICNGIDDDCDTFVDEVANPCYTFPVGCDVATGLCNGTCQLGVQGCTNGAPGACVGEVGPGTEICNGVDDDCDGVIDNGFNVGAPCDNGLQGACHATGVLVCNAQGGVSCTAPIIQPGVESCNGIDDDCDGTVDEQLGPPIGNQCGGGGTCGVGTFQCQNGQVVCVGSQTGTAESCNGLDDDCDGTIDEDVPGTGTPCEPPGTPPGLHYGPPSLCVLGQQACVGAQTVCQGWQGPQPEIPCNGIDEDCDGTDDQTCGNGQSCIQGGCRNPCDVGEFPCPLGQYCDVADGNFCVPDPCANIHCAPGDVCDRTANPPGCVSLCDSVTCPTNTTCVNGLCQDCFTLGCPTGQICVRDASNVGVCTADLCTGVTCPTNQFCRNGNCIDEACTPACADGQICREGVCMDDPCNGACTAQQVCNYDTGQCVTNRCTNSDGTPVHCAQGDACNPYNGHCETDPCLQISCGTGFECVLLPDGTGTCFNPPPTPKTVVTAAGGGCDAGAGGGGTGALVLLGAAIALTRRDRRRARGVR